MGNSDNLLFRYTEFPYLLDMLANRRLILPRALSWDDKNDRFAIKQYERLNKGKYCYALCMTSAFETYHHWRIFTSGVGGVCLKFKLDKLRDSLAGQKNVMLGKVGYAKLNEYDPLHDDLENIPFVKRIGYRDEQEYRLLVTTDQDAPTLQLELPVDAIVGCVINPWVNIDVAVTMINALETAAGGMSFPTNRTELIDSGTWQEKIKDAIDQYLVDHPE